MTGCTASGRAPGHHSTNEPRSGEQSGKGGCQQYLVRSAQFITPMWSQEAKSPAKLHER